MVIFKSVIVLADKVDEARAIAGHESFQIGIGEIWDAPATHYIEAREWEESDLSALDFCEQSDGDPITAMGSMQQVRTA